MDNPAQHGRYTGRTFDRSIGHREFRKTTVDCGFLSKKSCWGTLEQSPAGLLRLTLNIHEPADCKLSSAEVQLCFLHSDTGPSPHVTEYLYPDILCGPPLSQHKAHSHNIEPNVQVMGTSVGGVGMHRNAEWSKTHRWLLRGSRLADQQNYYTRAEWSWEANKLNEQSELRRAFQLAIIIAHSEPRIRVTVTIKGKLRHGWRRFKFDNFKDRPEAVHLELCREGVELESMIRTLAADITSLNMAPVPEHVTPSVTTLPGDVPAGKNDPPETALEHMDP